MKNKDTTTILIVDDQIPALHGMSRIMRGAGYETLEANNGIDCLKLAAEHKPDLILLDLGLPDIDGREVCKRIKSDPETADIYVVLVSRAHIEPDTQAEGLEHADSYIARPIPNRELIARVKAMLRLKYAENRLRDSEEQFRGMFEKHSAVMLLIEPVTGRILDANRAAERFYGYTAPQLRSMSIHEINMSPLGEVEAQRNLVSKKQRLANGEVKTVEIHSSLIEKKETLVLFSIIHDITEQKRIEEEALRNEARLEKIVQILHYKADSVQDFLDHALEEALELTQSKLGYIYHYYEDREEFVLNTWSKDVMKECSIAEPQTVYQLEKTGIWGEAVRQRQPIVVNDFEAPNPFKKGYPEGHAPLHRFMTVPVFIGDRIVAVVGVANKESDYDQADILQLTLLMDSLWRGVDRLQSQESLRQNEATLRTVLQSAPIGIGLVTNRIFGWINEHLCNMTGYSAADFVGQSARMLYESDEEFVRVGKVKYGQIKKWGSGSIETRWKCKNGSVIDIILSSSPIVPGDLSRGVVFSALDISERKRSEQDLNEAEERMRLLIESAPIAIRIATQGRYSYVNPAFLNLFGYDCTEEIEGLPVEALYVEKGKRLITERNENRAMGLDVDPHYRVTGIRKDGAHIDLEAWGSQISYQGQRSTLRFLIDVTESNALRAQLLQAQKMEAIGTLAGGIAHDFNNLLQTVLGYSDFMLQRKKEGEQDYTDLQKIYKAGKRGADLVKSLLTFSRKVETKYVPVDLNQEITQVRHLLSRTIPKTIKIDLHLSGDLESIKADPSQIGQILMNLGVNARDAMPDGGILSIETANVQLDKEYCNSHLEAMPGSYALLTFSDTGQGMSRKTLSHIFEPFFTTKERGKGTGLGLANVYGIVKQHNGHIMCYSEPGHGTTFKIYLPSIQKDKDLGSPTKETAIPRGTETILLVEDDDEIRELGSGLLNEFGYEVITAGNGREALKTYEREGASISLIILDLIMPVMDGRQCLAEILQINPNARVVIASGYSETGPVNGVMAAGAKGFIQKPYSMRQLLTTVREILDRN